METKRITFPLEGFNLSGGVRIILQVANGLASHGHRVRIIVPDYAADPPFRLHGSVELVIRRTHGAGFFNKLFYLASLCLTATRESDICFATGYKTPYCLCCAKWLRFSRAKLVYLIQHYEPLSHAGTGNVPSKRILPWLAKVGYKLPLKRIAVSNWIKGMIGDPTTIVIDNGVNLDTFLPANKLPGATDEFTIGTVAGAIEWKGYRVFLDAIRQIPAEEKQKMRLLVAAQSSAEMPGGLSAKLVKPSGDSQLVEFYHSCDIFVCSSFIEGFGLPALEAMACGIPVVTTSCGGVSQYANHSNCLMVPPGDSKAIADSIVRLSRDRNLGVTLRKRALETSRDFSVEKMRMEYVNLLQQI